MKDSRFLGTLCACAFALGVFFTSANAALIQGSVSVGGGFKPVDASGTVTDLSSATGIDPKKIINSFSQD